MKSPLLSILLVMAFVSIAVFGVFAMNQELGHSHSGCIAARTLGQDCQENSDVFSFISFHFGAFESFSLAVFGGSLGMMTLLLLVLALTGGFLRYFPSVFQYQLKTKKESSYLQEIWFSRWLALREKSPSSL
ncbi:MAG: hypothetical protein HYW70_03515 [Candidatus Nealsonbacteria bacterium]|nr:hypothetical protein [Candidatus Nealsonbacteria bacterium]